MIPAEPFPGKPDRPWLVTCKRCGVTAHLRFQYVLDKLGQELACRACYWVGWAQLAGPGGSITREQLQEMVTVNGYELVEQLHDPMDANLPLVVCCSQCRQVTVTRAVDLMWGCVCIRNQRSRRPDGAPALPQLLLHMSGLPAVDWWDHERNDDSSFRTATTKASRFAAWVCPECGHRFTAKVAEMVKRTKCPVCAEQEQARWERQLAEWRQTPIAAVAELAAAWADERDPASVMVAEHGLCVFRCPEGHWPSITPIRFLEAGCPHCRSNRTRAATKPLAQIHPELASQWHLTRNKGMSPDQLPWNSKRKVWWQSACCGAEWEESPLNRDKYRRMRCPTCQSILGSLAWCDPGLALEWASENPISAWHVRPSADTAFVPRWVCANDSSHRWEMPLASRSAGAGCPECREPGKSKVELAHFAAVQQVFAKARSGVLLRDPAFTTRTVWSVDILAEHDDGMVVIEYDGAYWHQPEAKHLVDARKTADLLAAGYRVVRLREDGLPFLELDHQHLLQLRVYSAAPDPINITHVVQEWLSAVDSGN